MRFFDANAFIGEPLYSGRTGEMERYQTAADLLAEMDRCGVSMSLVTHWDALKVHPEVGNRRLLEELAGHSRLLPCHVVLPHHTGEGVPPDRLVTELQRIGSRAVRLCPDVFHFSLEVWCSGPLLTALERARMLSIFDASPEELHSVCRRHPGLPVVATGGEPRLLYPLLAQHPNLRLALAGPSHPGLIEDICRRFGAERLLFASRHQAPIFPTGAIVDEPGAWRLGPSVTSVNYARISDSDKAAIAGGNVRGLLGLDWARSEVEPSDRVPGDGAVAQAARQGRPLPAAVTDMHYHLGPWAFSYQPDTDAEAALAVMETTGIARICVSSAAAVAGGDHYAGNREIASICRISPDRLIGIGVINPHFPDAEAEISRCIEEYRFRGLKVHPRTHQCQLLDAKYDPVWQSAERYGVHVQVHTGERQFGASPRAFATIAPQYPEVRFLLIHAGDNLEGLRVCLDVAQLHPNVYLGLSDVAFMYQNLLEYAVRRVGAHRIAYESDAGTIDPNYSLGIVALADLTDSDKAMILGGTAARLLGDLA